MHTLGVVRKEGRDGGGLWDRELRGGPKGSGTTCRMGSVYKAEELRREGVECGSRGRGWLQGGGQDQAAKVCPMSRGNLLICDLRNVFHDRRGL